MVSRTRSVSRGRRSQRRRTLSPRHRQRSGGRLSQLPIRSQSQPMEVTGTSPSRTITARQVAGALSGAALGGIVGNVSGAYIGGSLGYSAARRTQSAPPSFLRRVAKRGSQWYGLSTGRYAGRFKRPTKRGVNKTGFDTVCLQKGYHCTVEQYGRVDDPNCIYMGQSSLNLDYFVKAIAGAICHKLLKKAGVDTGNGDSVLPMSYLNYAGQWKIQWSTMQATTGICAYYEYSFDEGETLKSLAEAMVQPGQLGNHIKNWIFANNSDDLAQITLLSQDTGTLSNSWRNHCTLDLKNEHITIYVSAKMAVQNRTKAETSNSEAGFSTDRVDNQPLKGWIYHFKHNEPRLTNLSVTRLGYFTGADDQELNRTGTNGLILLRSAQLPDPYQEPPVPKMWNNCIKATKVTLQPGQIKTMYISHKFSGNLLNLLKKLRATKIYPTLPTTATEITGFPGTCSVIALEELLRTDTENKITLNYENEYKVGAYLTTKKRPSPMLTNLAHVNVNNTTPTPA